MASGRQIEDHCDWKEFDLDQLPPTAEVVGPTSTMTVPKQPTGHPVKPAQDLLDGLSEPDKHSYRNAERDYEKAATELAKLPARKILLQKQEAKARVKMEKLLQKSRRDVAKTEDPKV